MEVLVQKEKETLKVFLIGKLDATSAPDFEAKVSNLDGVTKVVVDAAGLEYISSAGLRVVLKLKHLVNDTGVINASAEVYG